MIEENEIKKIKEILEQFLQKMTITVFNINIESPFLKEKELKNSQDAKILKDTININIVAEEPQILIGQQGQTLFELQHLLRIILNKKFQKDFYVNLDINEYKHKKIEYLRELATHSANEVSRTKEKKILPPMPAYERRIIHTELTGRQDIITLSQGEGEQRCVVISPRLEFPNAL